MVGRPRRLHEKNGSFVAQEREITPATLVKTLGLLENNAASVSATIAGTAIAVALMPPLCIVGIAMAAQRWHLAWGAFLLYGTNLFGITLACMIVYRVAGHVRSTDTRAMVTTIVLTGLFAVPLALGFAELVRFERLESALSSALVSESQTFKHVQLVNVQVDWLKNPPVATLTVLSTQPISPQQVSDLERFAREKRTRRSS